MKTINIATDFSRFPAGSGATRIQSANGTRFRDEFLLPALREGGGVTVDFDGTVGYGVSFLEAAFGELGYTPGELRSRLTFVSEEDTSLRSMIWTIIDRGNSKPVPTKIPFVELRPENRAEILRRIPDTRRILIRLNEEPSDVVTATYSIDGTLRIPLFGVEEDGPDDSGSWVAAFPSGEAILYENHSRSYGGTPAHDAYSDAEFRAFVPWVKRVEIAVFNDDGDGFEM